MRKIFIDMDGVMADYELAFWDRYIEGIMNFPQSQVGFFLNLKPIFGAIKHIEYMLKNNNLDVYILTAPSYKNPACYMEKRIWIEKHFSLSFCEKLIICNDKSLIKMDKGDVLIDDHKKGRGQDSIDGQLMHFNYTTNSYYKGWMEIYTNILDLDK